MSSYLAAIEQLNQLTPELMVKAGQPRRKFSLDEVRLLLAALGDPQQRFRSVLIAGTNGKGSTAATLESILRAAGVRTGLYTSPHLTRANERIQMGGVEIDDERFGTSFFRVRNAGVRLVAEEKLAQLPSFFEILTAMAFCAFAEAGLELAVLEVGMGGRLDATNVVEPLLSMVTDIALDHTEWLGSTLAAIAGEKAGILRANGTLVLLPQQAEVDQVFLQAAVERGVRIVDASPYLPQSDTEGPYEIAVLGTRVWLDSPLAGAHQRRNVALAVAASVELAASFGITPLAIAAGVASTRWPGRLERLTARGVSWVLDVAHNPAGALALRQGLQALFTGAAENHPRVLLFSCLRDKAIAEMASSLFPLFEQVILAPIHSQRAASMEELLQASQTVGVCAQVAETVDEALRLAAVLSQGCPVVVSGSVYLVGEVRAMLTGERENG